MNTGHINREIIVDRQDR